MRRRLSLDLFDLLHAGEPALDHFTLEHFAHFLGAAGQYQDPELVEETPPLYISLS